MKRLLTLSAAIALAACSLNAAAADGAGGFIRGEVGNTEIDIDGVDGNDTSYGIRGGYFFNANFGVEAFYTRLGEDEDGGVSVDADTYGVGLVGKYNFTDVHTGFFISGRVGAANTKIDVDAGIGGSADDSSTQPYAGIGFGYDFTENFGLSVNADYQKADVFGEDVKFTSTSAALEYRF